MLAWLWVLTLFHPQPSSSQERRSDEILSDECFPIGASSLKRPFLYAVRSCEHQNLYKNRSSEPSLASINLEYPTLVVLAHDHRPQGLRFHEPSSDVATLADVSTPVTCSVTSFCSNELVQKPFVSQEYSTQGAPLLRRLKFSPKALLLGVLL
ncbi:hypothetical protein FALBO_10213 [Fusarium albosuccineum]|uniref:Secreted protein n=1 Tax=Fusarium albosuccineum TaxID=1237068 RepID=A0A8H4L7E9_9HYPO|nr:hypothetical protein FALBO_10213 [Fusarium albosuccineum]